MLSTWDGAKLSYHEMIWGWSTPKQRLTLCNIARRLKGASSRDKRFPEVLHTLWGRHFWSPSFLVVTCGGAPLEVVKRYVGTQNAPDRHPKRRTL